MKKAVLAFVIAAFAVAVQAGEGSCCAGKDQAACMDKGKTVCTSKDKSSDARSASAKKPLLSPKAATQVRS